MQENRANFVDKPCKCPPPIPPKTKSYMEYKDSIKSLHNSITTINLFVNDFKCETRLSKCPPPVPPKPPRKVGNKHVISSTENLTENTSKSNIRSTVNAVDIMRGILITSRNTGAIIFPTGSNLIDAFTTEDRDLFSNLQSVSNDVQNESSDECSVSSVNPSDGLNVDHPNEGVIEDVEKNGDDDDGGGGDDDDDLDHTRTFNSNSQSQQLAGTTFESLDEEASVSNINAFGGSTQVLEKVKRVKLTGSVSFTSFDNVRNSSAKEVNLKKQIFKQLFEQNERKKIRHANSNKLMISDDLCLGDGEFSDEDGSVEPESSPGLQFLQPRQNANKTDQSEKLFKIAYELLRTEESYVKRLYLIDQIFHFNILMANREHNMFPKEQIVQMFPNIKSIYEFHRDFLLTHLRNRIDEWNQKPGIGDIMKKFAPFLKLYTGYVQNFDNAINVIKFWTDRSREFCNLIDKLQKLPECDQMTLQHHMLEPIQRVPRYLVLLREYIKYLPEDSSDRSDSFDALDLVQKAASHSNESLRVCDQFQKMVSINERLGNVVNVIYPGRKFIKEGMLKRISPKDGTKTDRYLFLFHDMLLICQGVLKLKHHYRIKMKFDTSDLQLVEESHSLQTPESFHLICKEKYLELLACNKKSREEWINALHTCISSSRFRRSSEASQLNDTDLGKRAPLWTKIQETSMCMICTINFTFFFKKRHCHACGIVVCAKCSLNKVQLEFMANKAKRVCDKCYVTLQGISFACPMSSTIPRKSKCHHSLKMKAFDNHVLCGYLKISQDRKNWQDLYVTINDNFVLYTFKAHKDVKAHSSIPLPGYFVDTLPFDPKIFVIFHKGWSMRNYFSSDSESVTQLWIKTLRIVAEAELPQDFHGCLSHKCPHHSMLS